MRRRFHRPHRYVGCIPYWAYFTRKSKGKPAQRPIDWLKDRLKRSSQLIDPGLQRNELPPHGFAVTPVQNEGSSNISPSLHS